VKHNADQTFVLAPFQAALTTDRTKYNVIYQTKKAKKIFIGGENGKIAELKVEKESDSKSRALTVVRYLKKKVIGDSQKMRKVDKAVSSRDQQSVISKIIGNFFET
jgi:hypothetical protein